ncbi:hypothetical protein [Brachybacterium hainanense]|uniref:Uncharacterized protein n=1 Tax=Brachybacterium hainanense TaxID=1541174 RepID=A0ABV6RHC6_9MICO
MVRIMSLVGLLAPLLGAALLLRFRRRARGAAALGLCACAVALIGSGLGLLGERTAFLGGDLEGVAHHLESWSLARLGATGLALVLLLVAAISGEHATRSWLAPAATGLVLSLAGAGTLLVTVDLGPEHPGLAVLVGLAVETLRFALLGLGTVLLCLAAVASRPAVEDRAGDEPLALAGRTAARAWRMYRELGPRR